VVDLGVLPAPARLSHAARGHATVLTGRQSIQQPQFDAIFWIEKVLQTDGSHFMQLQYTQTVILSFLGISWPHISVATLVKQ
jgi:hypothetical protein